MLKRFSFEEKMRVLHEFSKRVMSPTGLIEMDELTKLPLPWELETFLLFSIKSKEWKNDSFSGKNEKHFFNAIKSIRNHFPPFLEQLEQANGPSLFEERLIMAVSAVQFDIQEYYVYKLYRYNYYFSFINENINMPELFQAKFHSEYADFIAFAQILWWVISIRTDVIQQEQLDFLKSRFQTVIENLSLTREEYIIELDSITTNISDYLYCLRPSYSYPFIIEQDKYYLPLPHLLMRSVTSSLMYRLTDGKNELTELIGKEVLEQYLYEIISESSIFDEVFPEQEYIDTKGRKQLTLDVLARKDSTYVFFDSKMHSPKRDIRLFDKNVIENEIDYLAGKCKQIYMHIHERFPLLYNPFSNSKAVNHDKVFGIVVIRENPHIKLEHIYLKTAELLNIDCKSSEFDWLCKHVGIAEIYQIEKFCFTDSDLISAIYANSQTGRINDFWLTSHLDCYTISNTKVQAFRQNLNDNCRHIAEECENA